MEPRTVRSCLNLLQAQLKLQSDFLHIEKFLSRVLPMKEHDVSFGYPNTWTGTPLFLVSSKVLPVLRSVVPVLVPLLPSPLRLGDLLKKLV